MLSEYWYVFIVAAFILVFFGVKIGGAAARAMSSRRSGLDPLNCAELKIGQKLELEGKLDQAAKAYYQIVEKYPDSETGYLFLGYLHKKRKDFRAAAEAFRGVLRLDPSGTEALCEVADALYRTGESKEAARLFSQVLERDPGNADAHYALGLILLDEARDEAIRHLKAFRDIAGRTGSKRFASMLEKTDEILGEAEKRR